MTAVAAVLICLTTTAISAAAPRCDGKRATIVRGDGGVTVKGTPRADVIVTGSGDDTVSGLGAGDRICTGPGQDVIDGGKGSDRVFSGGGSDTVDLALGRDSAVLGGGPDNAIGDRGNDRIEGGPGIDVLSGELDDDTLLGGAGADTLIGGLGRDGLIGAGASDLLRGDRGGDLLRGGPGAHDVTSYSTASAKPGVTVKVLFDQGNWHSSFYYEVPDGDRPGVYVDLDRGTAVADGGFPDEIEGVEDVVGSAFADALIGGEGPNILDGSSGGDLLTGQQIRSREFESEPAPGPVDPGDIALGGLGSDSCHWFAETESCGEEAEPGPDAPGDTVAGLNDSIEGASLIVSSGAEANHVTVLATGARTFLVRDNRGVSTGEGCTLTPDGAALCTARSAIGQIVVSVGDGDDQVRIDNSVPPSTSARILGEDGDDRLTGGRGDDIIEGGRNWGADEGDFDVLEGGGGNDALSATRGADNLRGGPGNDLMIDDEVCWGHTFSGGPGIDSVSFARTYKEITARLGGKVLAESPYPGSPARFDCPIPDHIGMDVEAFEGSRNDDVLYGNGRANRMQGRKGDDKLYGLGGADRLVGNEGSDWFSGGAGWDQILAADGTPDHLIRCGFPRGASVRRDANDRLGRDCQ